MFAISLLSQLARFSHEDLAAAMIRTEIDRHDEALALAVQAEKLLQAGVNPNHPGSTEHMEGVAPRRKDVKEVEWVSTGSPVKGVPLSGLAAHTIEDYAGVFTNLRSKLARRLAYDLGSRDPVSIPANQTVCYHMSICIWSLSHLSCSGYHIQIC